MENKYLSTTALSKELQVSGKEIFKILSDEGLLVREENNWVLTEDGIKKGGIVKNSPRFGDYIAWQEDFKNDPIFNQVDDDKTLINATTLAKNFGISKLRINPILSELGLLEKGVKGWIVTPLGISLGGKQFEYEKTGIPYVCWDESLLTNKIFLNSIKEIQGESPQEERNDITNVASNGFREKFEAKHRSADGHYVRSRAEMLIDNWLYMSEIVHAYERRLPISEDVYCDFYLPEGKVYIEFWGLEKDAIYLERKKAKQEIYKKYDFKLIDLNDADITNLDDILPKRLLQFGIQAY